MPATSTGSSRSPAKDAAFARAAGAAAWPSAQRRQVDGLFPFRRVRQWVLTVPWRRRWQLARHHDLVKGVLGIAIDAISAWYAGQAGGGPRACHVDKALVESCETSAIHADKGLPVTTSVMNSSNCPAPYPELRGPNKISLTAPTVTALVSPAPRLPAAGGPQLADRLHESGAVTVVGDGAARVYRVVPRNVDGPLDADVERLTFGDGDSVVASVTRSLSSDAVRHSTTPSLTRIAVAPVNDGGQRAGLSASRTAGPGASAEAGSVGRRAVEEQRRVR